MAKVSRAPKLAGLIDQIQATGAAALFVENVNSPALVQQIADETGLSIGGRLFSDSLSEKGGPASTYRNMMVHNLSAILTELEKVKLSQPQHAAPADAADRKAIKPVICYPPETLPRPPMDLYRQARVGAEKVADVLVPARDARTFEVPAGCFFRIVSVDGPQVGDLDLWNAGKTWLSASIQGKRVRCMARTFLRATVCGVRFPTFALSTIVDDSLDWYGFDAYGGSVHDVIGTRCDPYTANLLSGGQYHNCCHSNLSRTLAAKTGRPIRRSRPRSMTF